MAASDIIKIFLEFGSNAASVIDGVTAKVDRMGDKISKVGEGFLPFSLGAAAALGGAVKLAIDFDKALQGAARGLDLSEGEVKKFAKSMEDLQAEMKYQFSSTELANIATEAGKLGVAKDQIGDFAKNVVKLAVAVDQTDNIEDLSTNMAKIQTIFKLSVPELESFGAAMNKLDDVSSATAGQILTFSQMAGKVGAAFKVNQNVLAAYGTTLIGAGAKAGEAANFMNKFLVVLAAPTNSSKEAQLAIGKLGYNVSDLARRFDKDANGTMLEFIDRLNKLDNVTKRDVMGRIFGLEHIDNASLLTAQVDNLRKYLKDAGDSTGNLAKLNSEFDKMATVSFEGQFRTFTNMVSEVGKQIGMILLPQLNELLKYIQPILAQVVNFVQAYPGVAKYITFALLAVAAFAPLVMTIGAVVNGVSNLINFVGVAANVFRGVASLIMYATPLMAGGFLTFAAAVWTAIAPLAPFILAGIAIIAVGKLIADNLEPLGAFFTELFNGISATFQAFADNVTSSFNFVYTSIISIFNNIVEGARYYVDAAGSVFSNIADNFGIVFNNAIANAKYYGQMLIYGFIQGVQSYAQTLVNNIAGLMQTVRGYLPSSPSKYGALSDLDKTGEAFTRTFIGGIDQNALNGFMSQSITPNQSNTNSGLSIPVGGNNQTSTTVVNVEYSPVINGSKTDAQAILSALRTDQRGLQNLISDSLSKINRTVYT